MLLFLNKKTPQDPLKLLSLSIYASKMLWPVAIWSAVSVWLVCWPNASFIYMWISIEFLTIL